MIPPPVQRAGPKVMNENNPCPVSGTIDQRENIEWSISYAFHVTDEERTLPRVLLVGDSICNAYRDGVRELLEGKANVTFWASSYSVTRPEYMRLLAFMLDADDYAVVHFNNGLHSLDDDTVEWAAALEKALLLVRAKRPTAKIVWATSTPLTDPGKTAKAAELNAAGAVVAARLGGIATDDLFALLDPLDRGAFWCDTYHHTPEARDMEARQVADCVLAAIGGGAGRQA